MRHALWNIFAIGALIATPAAANANLTNIDDYDQRTGWVAQTNFTETLRYDAARDSLSYFVSGPFQYSNRLGCLLPCEPTRIDFDGVLAWNANVDELGAITDPGAMLWFGDFGSGQELLARGKLQNLGSSLLIGYPFPDRSAYVGLQFLFDIDYQSPRVSNMGNQMLLLFEMEFITTPETPFFGDFTCVNGHVPDMSGPWCGRYSDSGLLGVRAPEPISLPEPGTSALFSIGIAALAWARLMRRRSVLNTQNKRSAQRCEQK